MAYEYLVAALPMIFFEDPLPLASGEYRERCAGELSAADLAALDRILSGAPPEATAGAFERAWHDRQTQLGNEVASARAARRGIDIQGRLRTHAGYDVALRQAVLDAFERPNPFERERELDRARWRVLDELGSGNPFEAAAVLAYGAKLGIAERWAARTDEAGRERLDAWMEGTRDE